MATGPLITVQDMQNAALDDTFLKQVVNSTDTGEAGGFPISQATNRLGAVSSTLQARLDAVITPAVRTGLDGLGFFIASSSFIQVKRDNGLDLSAVDFGQLSMRGYNNNVVSSRVLTSNITILPTGAHWGLSGRGDIVGAILRIYALNDNSGSPIFGVAYKGGIISGVLADTSTSPASITTSDKILVNILPVGPFRALEVGHIRFNYTAINNAWTSIGQPNMISADGLWQPYPVIPTGFATPPPSEGSWMSVGKTVTVKFVTQATISNATFMDIDLPIGASQNSMISEPTQTNGVHIDNTIVVNEIGMKSKLPTDPHTLALSPATGVLWTAGGAKGAAGTFIYESL